LANAYGDSWSANIVHDDGEGSSLQPLNQQPLLQADAWCSFFGEHSAEHVPTPQAIQAWNGAWMNGPEVPFDWEAAAAEAGIQQGQQALGERLFGPGSAEQRLASTDGAARAAEEEKTVYEVADFSSLI
jgi:hypothetical protein